MSIHRAAFWSMGSQYIAFTLQFAVSVIIARFFLDPAEMGLFSIGLTVAMMVSVLQDFGISRFIIGQSELRKDTLKTCASMSCVFSALVACLILGIAWPAAQFYSEPRLFWILSIIAGSYVVVPWSVIPVALIIRNMDFKSLFKVNVSGVCANAIAALSFAYLGFSAESLAWATVAQAMTRAIVAQLLVPSAIPWPLNFSDAGPVMKFGSASSVLAVSGAIGVRSPDLVIGRILGLASVGLFSRASGLAGQLHTLVLGAISGIFYPAFARLRDEGKPFGPDYERVVAAYGALIWPAMTVLAVAAYPMISFLYGEKWEPAAPLLTALALSEICFVALPLHVDIPILLGRFRQLLYLNIVDTVISIGTLIIAAQYGILAAAISRIGYGILWFALYATFMRRLIGFRWSNMLSIYVKSMLVSLLSVAPLLLTYQFWMASHVISFVQILPSLSAGGILWFVSLFIVRHPARHEIIHMAQTVLAMPVFAWVHKLRAAN
jgi:O-antigen/teichoic acid export membrane protein